MYRNSFGEIYIRDKPKYLTLNSNNLNNYRYSEINNFLSTDILSVSTYLRFLIQLENIAPFLFQPDVVKNIISSDMMISVYYAGLSCQFLLMYAAQYATLNVSIPVLMICE